MAGGGQDSSTARNLCYKTRTDLPMDSLLRTFSISLHDHDHCSTRYLLAAGKTVLTTTRWRRKDSMLSRWMVLTGVGLGNPTSKTIAPAVGYRTTLKA
jgi:hypothetical protein